MMASDWEGQFSRLERWAQRGARLASWRLRKRRNILVELRWRLGDELMALPALHALRQEYADEHIALLTNFPELFAYAGVADALNAVPGRVDWYAQLRGAPRLTPRWEYNARRLGVPVLEESPLLRLPPWQGDLPAGTGKLIALAPGASWPTKRWPAARWAELASRLRQQGARLMGLGQGEERVPGVHVDFVDATTALEAGQLLSAADVLVCCDSGLMHLALAVGTPTVGLFGPTDPAWLTRSPLLRPVCATGACAGFWNHRAEAPPPGQCYLGHDACLDTITVDDVLSLRHENFHLLTR